MLDEVPIRIGIPLFHELGHRSLPVRRLVVDPGEIERADRVVIGLHHKDAWAPRPGDVGGISEHGGLDRSNELARPSPQVDRPGAEAVRQRGWWRSSNEDHLLHTDAGQLVHKAYHQLGPIADSVPFTPPEGIARKLEDRR